MRILFVSEYYPPITFGGGERSAYSLAKAMADQGHDIAVLTSGSDNLKPFERKDKIDVYRHLQTGANPYTFIQNVKRATIFDLSTRKEIKALAKERKFDIIHALNSTSVSGVANAGLNIQLVATINSYVTLCPKGNLFYKEKSVCSGCSFYKFTGCMLASEYIAKHKMSPMLKYNPLFSSFIYSMYHKRKRALKNFNLLCRSSFIKDFVIKNKLTSKKISISYGIFTPPNSRKKDEKIKKRIKNSFVITYIGSLEKIKGVDFLLRAFSKIKDKKNALLLIIGEGSEKKNLVQLSHSLGIKHRVVFKGKVEYDKIPYIIESSSLITFFPRWPEPLSRVLTESLYYNKPILASHRGGNKEAVIDGKNGYLLDFNSDDVAIKIEELLNNPKKVKSMGNESGKIFKKKFQEKKIVSNIISFYSNLD